MRGGIIGAISEASVVVSCYNSGYVFSNTCAAGIVGNDLSGNRSIIQGVNTGEIEGNTENDISNNNNK